MRGILSIIGAVVVLIIIVVIIYFAWVGWSEEGRPVPEVDLESETERATE